MSSKPETQKTSQPAPNGAPAAGVAGGEPIKRVSKTGARTGDLAAWRWMVFLTLCAAGLRLADLAGRSMWLDEGYTLARLAGSWQDILTNVVRLQGQLTIDFHPPAYFVLLKAWSQLVGDGEFALKLVSAAFGVLVVPATYVLARRLFTRRIGLLAAAFAVLCPPYQWYSQEMRMYSLVPLLAALSTYFLYKASVPRARSAGPWLAWAGITVLSLLTHYVFAGLLGAHLVFIAVAVLALLPPILRRGVWVVIGVTLVALFAAAAGPGISVPLGERQVALNIQTLNVTGPAIYQTFTYVLEALVFGMSASDPLRGVSSWLVAGLCVLGGVLPWRRQFVGDYRARLLALLSGVGVIVIVYAALAAAGWWIDFRYFILAVPALHVLLARALLMLWGAASSQNDVRASGWSAAVRQAPRALAVLALIGLWIALGWSTLQTFVRTSLAQDDWRAMAQYIGDHWRDGDTLVAGPFTPELVLSTYLRDLPIPVKVLADIRPVIAATSTLSQPQRLWYAGTGREKSTADNAAEAGGSPSSFERMYLREKTLFNGRTDILELSLLEAQPPLVEAIPDRAYRAAAAPSAGSHRIAAYEILPGFPQNALPNILLRTYWKNGGPEVPGEQTVSVRLLDAERRAWADWMVPAQLESAPEQWSDRNFFIADYQIPLPLGLPPLSYTLELSVRSGAKPELAQVMENAVAGDDVQCCVRMTSWPQASAAAAIQNQDDVSLVGAEYQPVIRPGHMLPVALTWQINKPASEPLTTGLKLEGLFGGVVVTSSALTGGREYPVTSWTVGEPVRDMQSLFLPFATRPGYYRLSLEQRSGDGLASQVVPLGWVEVQAYPRTPVVAQVQHPVNAEVGELSLLGYGLDQPFSRGTSQTFHTYWRVNADPTRDGTLFLHVIGPDGNLVAQDDSPPEEGRRSTLTYRAGDGIDQLHRLLIPERAPDGEYRVYAGVYNSSDKVRWPAEQDGQPAKDNLVFLGALTLSPMRNNYLPCVRLD